MSVYIYGMHSVENALKNPQRKIHNVWCVDSKLSFIESIYGKPKKISKNELDKAFPADCHQGVVIETEPLITPLETISIYNQIILLDQLQDLRNIGSILRSAAAFNFQAALISTSAHCPNILEQRNYGQLAKSASGALEHIDLIPVKNISQAIDKLKNMGFWIVGLDEKGEKLEQATSFEKTCLIIGKEGDGLRELTKKHCDLLCNIGTNPNFGCLNASVAGAVSMFELNKHKA